MGLFQVKYNRAGAIKRAVACIAHVVQNPARPLGAIAREETPPYVHENSLIHSRASAMRRLTPEPRDLSRFGLLLALSWKCARRVRPLLQHPRPQHIHMNIENPLSLGYS